MYKQQAAGGGTRTTKPIVTTPPHHKKGGLTQDIDTARQDVEKCLHMFYQADLTARISHHIKQGIKCGRVSEQSGSLQEHLQPPGLHDHTTALFGARQA
ncbi:hypothetical protein WJX77_000994 [Trebouxia sp. C0004]